MSAPTQIEVLKPLSFFQTLEDDRYYMLVEVSDSFFLLKITDPDLNLVKLFTWIHKEQSKKGRAFSNKPLKCVFTSCYTSKYKSLLANGGDKIKHILNSIRWARPRLQKKPTSKLEIKKRIQNHINQFHSTTFYTALDEEVNIERFKLIHPEVNVLYLLYHFRFMDFLLTYEVPYVMKSGTQIYLFEKKELDKFCFDVKFLYSLFKKSEEDEVFNLLNLLQQYSSYI